jgi:tetratricopeptide (TPR) repeat protein
MTCHNHDYSGGFSSAKRFFRSVLRVGIASFLFLTCSTALAQFTSAQERFAEYEQATTEIQERLAQNDREGAEKSQDKARMALLSCRRLYEAAAIEETEDVEARLGYGQVLRLLEDHDLAAAFFLRSLDIAPESAPLWKRYGEAALVGPEPAKAVEALRKSLSLKGLSEKEAAQVHAQLGFVYLEQRVMNAARASFLEASRLDGDLLRPKVGMAMLKIWEGDVKVASADLDQLGAAVLPMDAEIRRQVRSLLSDFDRRHSFKDVAENHAAYGKLLYWAARPADAVFALNRALTLAPNSVEHLNFIARIHLQVGNGPAAQRALERSLTIEPAQEKIQGMLEQLKRQRQEATTPKP